MKVLVINAGSSSLKYQLLDTAKQELLAKGLCERIGLDAPRLKHEPAGKDKYEVQVAMPDHAAAISAVIEALTDADHGVVKSMDEVDAVGHRVVHGGDFYAESVLIDEDVKKAIKACYGLSPLHNPANMTGIEACEKLMPGKPMVAVFDTAFHQTMPARAFMYGLPYKYYEEDRIRRYGAHGTSHRYVSQRAADIMGRDPKNPEGLRLVTLHLGNGSSLAAVVDGKVQDTSMGLTPLEGPLMGTRCGNIDPAIVGYLMDKHNLSTKDIDRIMNKESGVLGISGVSSDFRDLEAAAKEGNERAQLALDMFAYQVRKIMGSYIFAMGGVDALVFTAGIGENDAYMRKQICAGLADLGIEIDDEKNSSLRGKEADLATEASKVRVLLIPTNEELMIAKDTEEIVKNA
ncbi:MAG: acetate kinase [Eubacteriales bacterium]|nr:acetate kinase [Eubacteriales bacterium]